jgi:hypothetical protein
MLMALHCLSLTATKPVPATKKGPFILSGFLQSVSDADSVMVEVMDLFMNLKQ